MPTALHMLTAGLADVAAPLSLDELDRSGFLGPLFESFGCPAGAQPRAFSAGQGVGCSHDGEWDVLELAAGNETLFLCGDATSSLDVARILTDRGALPEWGMVLVLSQSAGRGQLRRPWVSPRGNVYAALRLPADPPFTADYAALSVGCMLAEGFRTLGIPVQLKWPNDILLDDCKVGGILLEERADIIIAGIGINCTFAPPVAQLRDGWAVRAASLLEKGYDLTPLALFASLVKNGRFWYLNEIRRAGHGAFPSCAERHLAWMGRGIVVHGGDVDDKPGRIAGLSSEGGLRVRFPDGERVILSGSIVPGS